MKYQCTISYTIRSLFKYYLSFGLGNRSRRFQKDEPAYFYGVGVKTVNKVRISESDSYKKMKAKKIVDQIINNAAGL
jgi:hypothetical protein